MNSVSEKEKGIQSRMVKRLRSDGVLVKERPTLSPPGKLKQLREAYIPDIVGIDEDGKVFVVECKTGMFNRPSEGLGRLLLYRRLVRDHFPQFKAQLKEYYKKEGYEEIASKARKEKVRYVLALGKARSKAREEFLRKFIGGIRDPKVKLDFV